MRLTLDEIERLARAALVASGAAEHCAAPVATSIRDAEAEGISSHGLSYLLVYCGHLRVGKVDGRAVPQVSRTAPAVLAVDAANGFAHRAFEAAIDEFVAMTRDAGTASLSITRSYSAGVLGWFLRRLAQRDLVAFGCSNAGPLMPAWGGKVPRFGTNPLGFAAPVGDGREPIVFDMAASTTARRNVIATATRGETLPEGWALDADGRPTTDPAAALGGMVAPLGGAKGSGLALMVDVFAAGLSGANYSYAASGLLDDEGGPPGVGQLFVAFDPDRFPGADSFGAAIAALADVLTAEPGVRLPGGRRADARAAAAINGVDVADDIVDAVRAVASARG